MMMASALQSRFPPTRYGHPGIPGRLCAVGTTSELVSRVVAHLFQGAPPRLASSPASNKMKSKVAAYVRSRQESSVQQRNDLLFVALFLRRICIDGRHGHGPPLDTFGSDWAITPNKLFAVKKKKKTFRTARPVDRFQFPITTHPKQQSLYSQAAFFLSVVCVLQLRTAARPKSRPNYLLKCTS